MRKILFFFILLFYHIGSLDAQTNVLDSLKNELQQSLVDSTKIKLIENIVKKSADLDSVSHYALEGMKLAQSLDSISQYAYISNLWLVKLYRKEKFEEAIELSRKVLEYATQYPDSLNIARSYYNLGLFTKKLYQYNLAIQHYQNSMLVYESIKDSLRLTQVIAGLASLYDDIEENDKAMQLYLYGLDISLKTDNWEDAALISNGIGVLYYHQKQYKESVEYHENAYEYASKINDIQYMMDALINMGASFFEMGLYDKALNVHHEVVDTASKYRYSYSLSSGHDNLGGTYKKLKDYKKAEYHLKKGLEIRRGLRSKRHIVASLNNLGLFYEEVGALQDAKKMYEEAIEICNDINEKELKWAVLKGYGDVLWKTRSYQKAKPVIDSAFVVRDMMFSENQTKAINFAEIRYQTKKWQDSTQHLKEINLLVNEDYKKEKRISTLNRWLLLGAVLIAMLLFYLFQVKKTQNQQLESSNQTLLKLNEELLQDLKQKESKLLSPEVLSNKTITLTSNGKEVLKLGDIYYFEAEDKAVRVFAKDKIHRDWVLLKVYEEILPTQLFIRIHRSFIINVLEIKSRTSRVITMNNGEKINIGVTYRNTVNELLDNRDVK